MFKKKIKFPPDFPGLKPKVKKTYEHRILVSSINMETPLEEIRRLAHAVLDGDKEATEEFETYFAPVFQFDFTSENAAKEAEKILGKATNGITVEREKQEVPQSSEEGILL